MLTPVRCFTCGYPIGNLAALYHYIRRRRMVQIYGEDSEVAPNRAAVDPTLSESVMGDVLEALKIHGCCRTHLVTAMIFSDHY